jgi:hypothetical protein
LRLEQHRSKRKEAAVPVEHVEKDRTGILAGKAIAWPIFDNVAKPLLGLLGTTQVAAPSEDEVGLQAADALDREEMERGRRSVELAAAYTLRFQAADSAAQLQAIGRELTPGIKTQFTTKDLERVRNAFAASWYNCRQRLPRRRMGRCRHDRRMLRLPTRPHVGASSRWWRGLADRVEISGREGLDRPECNQSFSLADGNSHRFVLRALRQQEWRELQQGTSDSLRTTFSGSANNSWWYGSRAENNLRKV